MKNSATIMMVTYNRLDLTKETLNCLYKNTKYPFYLSIVDNNSTDGTIQFLNKEFVDCQVLPKNCMGASIKFMDENRGVVIGRNIALKQAVENWESDWLCTLDNDVEVPDGWLTESIEILKANPSFGAIGVNMEGRNYSLVNLNGKRFQKKPRGNLGTACMVFHRNLHRMLGYFNTEYKLYGHEDADFGFRVRVAGLKLGYIEKNGLHIGEGARDQGEYREFKNKYHKENLGLFNRNCRAYSARQKPIFIPFRDE